MAEIYIYDVIGEDWFGEGVTANKIRQELADAPKDEELRIRINSPGGDVFQGIAIRNLIAEWDGEISVQVDGLAASAASIIAMQKSVTMASAAMIMIHDPWTLTIGNAAVHAQTIRALDKIADSAATVYASRSGQTDEMAREWMKTETWFSADEAIEMGLADFKTAATVKSCPIDPRFGYKHADRWLKVAASASMSPDAGNLASHDAMRRQLSLLRMRIPV